MELDKELHKILRDNAEKMDRVAKSQWLVFLATQQQMKDRTPSNTTWGSYGFNPGNSATYPAAWRQLVPRNDRRRSVKFYATPTTAGYQSLYFASSDTILDINSLINLQNNGSGGASTVSLFTFAPGSVLELFTTDAVWCASLTGSGSVKEQQAVINWTEDIFSNVAAIPTGEPNDVIQRPGVVSKLTTGAMQLDGDVRATYTHDGVR